MARSKAATPLAAERELSLAEITRRGLELFLDRFPNAWQLLQVDGGGLKVSLESLHDLSGDEEAERSLPVR